MNYYNENDGKSAAWIRELIKSKIIPAGHVDERSIVDVRQADLAGFTQCHFFAGIGGWSYALRLAGWSDDEEVWTGSCSCQPFSCAGSGMGEADERHLWPYFRNLIGHCRPTIVFGEQVASPLGLKWLFGVRAGLARAAYAFGCADLCAASKGAPHIRQRAWWVAESEGYKRTWSIGDANQAGRPRSSNSCGVDGMVQPNGSGRHEGQSSASFAGYGSPFEPTGDAGGMDDSTDQRTQRSGQAEPCSDRTHYGISWKAGSWDRFDILPCRDGKSRRVESGTFPLAHGVPGRVGLLRGYGNAIVPEVAAEFIQAYLEAVR